MKISKRRRRAAARRYAPCARAKSSARVAKFRFEPPFGGYTIRRRMVEKPITLYFSHTVCAKVVGYASVQAPEIHLLSCARNPALLDGSEIPFFSADPKSGSCALPENAKNAPFLAYPTWYSKSDSSPRPKNPASSRVTRKPHRLVRW